jgi:hypothetical protein
MQLVLLARKRVYSWSRRKRITREAENYSWG